MHAIARTIGRRPFVGRVPGDVHLSGECQGDFYVYVLLLFAWRTEPLAASVLGRALRHPATVEPRGNEARRRVNTLAASAAPLAEAALAAACLEAAAVSDGSAAMQRAPSQSAIAGPPLYVLPVLLAASLLCLYAAISWLQPILAADPALAAYSGTSLIPTSLDDLSSSAAFVHAAARQHFAPVLGAWALAYLIKMSFSLPGGMALNVFAGVAFGRALGVPLTALLSAAGASGAYLVSSAWGAALISRCGCAERILPLRLRIGAARKQRSLFFYVAALRMTAFFPQWLLNLSAPHVGIPLPLFALCTLVGSIPFCIVTVSVGATVAELSASGGTAPIDWNAVFSPRVILGSLALAALCVVPGLCMRRVEARLGLPPVNVAQTAPHSISEAGAAADP